MVMLGSGALVGGVVGIVLLRQWLIRAFRIQDRAPVDTPQAHGLVGEAVRVPTKNRKTLSAHLFVPDPGAPTVVIIHGWGASASHMLFLAPDLLAAGINAVLFDGRGHGASDDDTFASLPRFAEDTEAVLALVRERTTGPVVLLGHSLGAGAALLVASRTPDLAAVIALSAFAHPEHVMNAWMAEQGVPRGPLWRLINRMVEMSIGHRFDVIAPQATVRAVGAPLLLVHGEADTMVPPWHLDVIAAAAPQGQVLRLPGVGHNDPEGFARHRGAILAWLKETLALAPAPEGALGEGGEIAPFPVAGDTPVLHREKAGLH